MWVVYLLSGPTRYGLRWYVGCVRRAAPVTRVALESGPVRVASATRLRMRVRVERAEAKLRLRRPAREAAQRRSGLL